MLRTGKTMANPQELNLLVLDGHKGPHMNAHKNVLHVPIDTTRICSIHDVGLNCAILVQGDIAMKRVTHTCVCVFFVITFSVDSLCLNLN
jgi:hypothetical protein